MKKLQLFIYTLSFIILTSCGTESKSFDGIWYDNETERKVLEIEKFDDNYSLKLNNQMYSILKENDKFTVQVKDKNYPLSYSEKENAILFDGKKYIPYDQTITDKLLGRWNNKYDKNEYLFQLNENKVLQYYGRPLKISKQGIDGLSFITAEFKARKWKGNIGIGTPEIKNDTLFTTFYLGEGDEQEYYKSWNGKD